MNYEQDVDLTKLGSGMHEPITGFPHAEIPLISPDDTPVSGLIIGQPVENKVIMQYLQPRTESRPIVNTLAIDEKTGLTHSQTLLASNI